MQLTSTTDSDADVQAALAPSSEAPPPAAPSAGTPAETAATTDGGAADDADGAGEPTSTPEDAAVSDAARLLAARRNKGSYQARIDQLTAKNRALERQLEAERTAKRTAAPPDPGPAPKQEDFSDYDELEQAKREHTARTLLVEQHQREEQAIEAARRQAQEAEAIAQFQARVAAAKAELPDFEKVVNQQLPISAEMRIAIVESDLGPQLAYFFGTHPEEAAELAQLSGPSALRAIGKLEARLEAARTPGPTSDAAPRSAAPPPVKPVGGGATASRLPLDHPDVSFKEYEARRAAGER